MKKYILTTAMIAISYLGFAQTSQAGLFRIADRGTATISQNLPAGTTIFAIADSSLWVVKANGVASGVTVNAAYAAGNVTRINKGIAYTVDQFDVPAVPAAHTLTQTPVGGSTGISVSLNGAVLKEATDFTLAGTTLTILVTEYQYDRVSVAYTYLSN